MSSALKNFFLTFVLALVCFVPLAIYKVEPWFEYVLDINGNGDEVSSESSDDASDTSSSDISGTVSSVGDDKGAIINENGDVFTAVILAMDDYDRVVNAVFIDSNEKTEQYIYCTIPIDTKVTNSAGALVPIEILFGSMSPDEIADCVTAMTGIQTDYCLIFKPDDMAEIAGLVPGANVTLSGYRNKPINFMNPKYAGYVIEPGNPEPDDYYVNIEHVDDKILLNPKIHGEKTVNWLLDYDKANYGEENIYSDITKALMEQFFRQKSKTMSMPIMSDIIELADTNMSKSDVSDKFEIIFAYDEFNYTELVYPSIWGNAVEKLRALDGSYS